MILFLRDGQESNKAWNFSNPLPTYARVFVRHHCDVSRSSLCSSSSSSSNCYRGRAHDCGNSHSSCSGGDVLKLIGDDIDRGRKGSQGGVILIARRGAGMGHIRGRWVGRRLIDMGFVSQSAGGHRQHAAQLPAAQNSDGRARLQHLTHPSAHPGSNPTRPRATRPAAPPAPGQKSPKSPPPSARHWPPPPPQSP